jgi:hypothetical protein
MVASPEIVSKSTCVAFAVTFFQLTEETWIIGEGLVSRPCFVHVSSVATLRPLLHSALTSASKSASLPESWSRLSRISVSVSDETSRREFGVPPTGGHPAQHRTGSFRNTTRASSPCKIRSRTLSIRPLLQLADWPWVNRVNVSLSGRRDSNPRRPAWEAGILPLNYARKGWSRSRALRLLSSDAAS